MRNAIHKLAAGIIGIMLAFTVQAQSFYYDPEAPGHGITVSKDSGQGSAFVWFLYDRSGDPSWLISTENCTDYPCKTGLAQSVGTWMGGDYELVRVGEAKVNFIDGDLVWDYNISGWPAAGDCGRLVWLYQTKCAGSFTMKALD